MTELSIIYISLERKQNTQEHQEYPMGQKTS